jgi:hypothetical protein
MEAWCFAVKAGHLQTALEYATVLSALFLNVVVQELSLNQNQTNDS